MTVFEFSSHFFETGSLAQAGLGLIAASAYGVLASLADHLAQPEKYSSTLDCCRDKVVLNIILLDIFLFFL